MILGSIDLGSSLGTNDHFLCQKDENTPEIADVAKNLNYFGWEFSNETDLKNVYDFINQNNIRTQGSRPWFVRELLLYWNKTITCLYALLLNKPSLKFVIF